MPARSTSTARSGHRPGQDAPPATTGTPVALLLSSSLALVALAALPLAGGGYSGAGYLCALVLLPVALAIGWPRLERVGWLARWSLPLLLLSGLQLPLLVQEGRTLWAALIALPLGWAAGWLLLSVRERAGLVLPVLTASAALTALGGVLLWLVSGSLATRLVATFGLPNAFAGYLLLAWPLAALCLARAATRALRAAYAAALLLLLGTLVLTYSRAGWMILALQLVALLLLWLFSRRPGQPAAAEPGAEERSQAPAAAMLPGWLGGGIALLLLGLLALPSVREVLARVADFGGYSMTGRLRFWEAALAIWRDNPLLGVGLGNFGYVYPQYQRDPWWYSVDPHSWPLQLLSELGIPGLLLLVALLAGCGLWLRRVWRGLPPLEAGLLSIAVLGSMAHAAVDFDYTFGATTGLLGVLLAYGSRPAGCPAIAAVPGAGRRLGAWATSGLLALLALWGVSFTAERYTLDRLRDTPGLSPGVQRELLTQALQANPLNHQTHYRLASLYSRDAATPARKLAAEHVDRALLLNPRYAPAWALRGLLRGPHEGGEADLARAIEVDPWNYPEHWFSWATLTEDEDSRRQRLRDGLGHIQVTEPVTPADVRSDWIRLNGVFARWYYELARLSDDPHEASRLRQVGARFEQAEEQRKREEQQRQATPAAPSTSSERVVQS